MTMAGIFPKSLKYILTKIKYFSLLPCQSCHLAARAFGIKVEKFYLFFDAWGFKFFSFKVGDTEYGLGWLPLGGYVKIAGMIDESMDTEQLKQPAQEWEFRSKPAWQRLIIMLGGVTVNLLLGMFIYICVVFAYGEDKLNPADIQNGLAIHPYMEKYGFNSGDNIIAVDGKKVENILEAMASNIYKLGDRAGFGSKVKIINQLLAGVHIAVAAEAMALGIREGVDPNALYDVITHSAGNSWMFENRMAHVLQADYTALSAVDIFIKDLGLVLDTARASKFPLPLAATAHQMFMQASAAGYGREDDAAVIKIFPGIRLPDAK